MAQPKMPPTKQHTGLEGFEQLLVLQLLVWYALPLQDPPFDSCIFLKRDRDCVPPPQFFEQDPHLFQLPQTQFSVNEDCTL